MKKDMKIVIAIFFILFLWEKIPLGLAVESAKISPLSKDITIAFSKFEQMAESQPEQVSELSKLHKNSKLIQSLEKNKSFSTATVSSQKINQETLPSRQSLKSSLVGVHPSSCKIALKKLSRYETYKDFLPFVKESSYQEDTSQVSLKVKSKLLPIIVPLTFNLPRIEKAGSYPFTIQGGLFDGLKGTIYIQDLVESNRCFFTTLSHWEGVHTGFPNIVIQKATTILSKSSMQKLFSVSAI